MRIHFRVFHPFILGLLCRPLLLAVVGLMFAVLFGMGESLGMPGLFWDLSPWVQFAAGLGVGLLFFQVCFVAYLLDDGKEAEAAPSGWAGPADFLMGWVAPDPPGQDAEAAADEHWAGLRCYLLATWVPLLLAVGIVSLFYSAVPDAPSSPLRLGLVGSVGLTALFLRLFHFLRRRLPGGGRNAVTPTPNLGKEVGLHLLVALAFGAVLVPPWPGFPTLLWCFLAGCWATAHGGLLALYHFPRKPRGQVWKHFLAGALFGTFFVIYQLLFLAYCLSLWFPAAADWISPPPALVVCALLSLLVNVHGFLSFHYRGRHYFAAAAAVVLIGWVSSVISQDPFPLRFPHLADYYERPVRLDEMDFQAALSDPAKKDKDDPEELRAPFDHLRRRYLTERRRTGDLPPASDENPATRQAIGDECDRLRANLLGRQDRRLEAWRKRLMKGTAPPKLAVVAVSGGAARAAFWTARVLDELEQTEELRPFPAHVRIITGASGGMVGAAHWTATLNEGGHTDPAAYQAEDLARDNLTPVADALLFADLPTWPSGHVRDTDRGRALETGWRRSCPDFDRGFRDLLGRGEAEGWRPSLIFSPMLVEDGRRLLISNLYLPFLTENVGETLSTSREGAARPRSHVPPDEDRPAEGDRYRYSVQALEFFHLFPEADDFRLGTAARMSAAFPYVSPAAELPTLPRRRVVDAGYYDDYGVDLAADWIRHYRRWIVENTSGVVLIQVRDAASSDRVLYADGDVRALHDLEWLTGPLAGLLSARQSVMSFRNDEQVQALSSTFNVDGKRDEMFTTVVFESTEAIEMNWRLTPQEQERLTQGLQSTTNQAALKKLIDWWGQRHDVP